MTINGNIDHDTCPGYQEYYSLNWVLDNLLFISGLKEFEFWISDILRLSVETENKNFKAYPST